MDKENLIWKILKDIPQKHRLPFAVFHIRQCGMDDYKGAALFYNYFTMIDWFTECARQRPVDRNGSK